MIISEFEIGDLVEIQTPDTDFKAHNNGLTGKIGLVIKIPSSYTQLDLCYVYIEGFTTPVMAKHLKKVSLREKK